MGLGTL